MARIRTIKPEFFQQKRLAQCSPHARLLAIAVLQLCDSNGVFRLVPMQVHAHAFPWETEVNVRGLLQELQWAGYLETYTVAGKEYGFVDGFRRHQRLTGKEAQSGGYYPQKIEVDQEDKEREAVPVAPGSNGETAGKHLDAQEKEQGNREQGNRSSVSNDTGGEPPSESFSEAKAPAKTTSRPSHPANRTEPDLTEKEVYDYGKRILGQKAGGQITKLKQMYNYDLRSVYDVLEQAADKQSPLEWIGAVLRGDTNARTPWHELFPPAIYSGVL